MTSRQLLAISSLLGAAFTAYMLHQRCTSMTRFPSKLKKCSVGIDIGGTGIKLALISTEYGTVLDSVSTEIAASKTPQDIVDQLHLLLSTLLLKRNSLTFADLEVIGICVPGRISSHYSVVSTVANLSREWLTEVPLVDAVFHKIGKQTFVRVFNDAKAALMGEVWSGSAASARNVVMITLGTGVGGAVLSDGHLLQGHTGMFGEVGHHIVNMTETGLKSLSTGVNGIVELYCSTQTFQRLWQQHRVGNENVPSPTAAEILKQAEAGDETSLQIVREVARNIAVVVINCCRMFDPEVFILGGGLVHSKVLFTEVSQETHKLQWTLAPPTFRLTRAMHLNLAGAIGSVKLALLEKQRLG